MVKIGILNRDIYKIVIYRQDIAFSLILGPDIHRDLRGEFFLLKNSNPLKYYALPISFLK